VDELGFVPLSKTGAEMLFEVFRQRYERTSTLVTSNLLLPSEPICWVRSG
jgi:DNA replication protein DnaC